MTNMRKKQRSRVRRRPFTVALAFAAVPMLTNHPPSSAQQLNLGSGSVVEAVRHLKPGQFVWAPEVAPTGPMLLIVNVTTQRAVVFRNGVPIAASTVSTGRPGRDTPTGVFTILQKHVEHYSSVYNNAPMPYMQRLTWQGVALHAGNLPGYPASHGCIRLPPDFAKLLYGATKIGMTVVITRRQTIPLVAPTPTIVTQGADARALTSSFFWEPEKSPTGPVSILVSATDQRAIVLRNGEIIGVAAVSVDGTVTGTWAYALRNIDGSGQHWVRLTLSAKRGEAAEVAKSEWSRFHAADDFRRAVAGIVAPGTTIVVTSDSLLPANSGKKLTVIEAPQQ
jgi:lipoprotein-anchoring transpeptidase ErfK/SrfK